VHMHITYECTQVETQVVDVSVEKQIADNASRTDIIKQHEQSLHARIEKLNAEKREVARVSAHFACFLKHNAIAPYNDATLDYLKHLIEVEKGKVHVGGDKDVLRGLEEMISMCKEEVKILDEAISSRNGSGHVPTVEEIGKLYKDISRLEIAGPMLMKAVKVAKDSHTGAMQRNEKRIQPFFGTGNSAVMSQPRRDIAGRIKHGVGFVVNKVWQ